MNVVYKHKKEMNFIGFHTGIAPNEGYKKYPEFREREYATKYASLWQTMKPKTAIKQQFLKIEPVCMLSVLKIKKVSSIGLPDFTGVAMCQEMVEKVRQ